jgi:hypothetical protein
MKKSFMMMAAAALVLGVSSCNNDPGGNGPVDPVNGEATGMSLSLTLPGGSGGGLTRQLPNDGSPIAATAAESAVNNVHVFIFKGDRTVATPGGYTPITTLSEYFGPATNGANNTVVYEMIDSKMIQTAAGPVRVWVGINLPASFDVPSGGFATEDALLAEIEEIPDMSGTSGFTMFSNVIEGNLAPLEAGQLPESGQNELGGNLYRVVTKVVASVNATAATNVVQWETAGEAKVPIAGAFTPTLTYTTSHWRVFQDAKDSFVAPHYNVASPVGRPETYPGLTPSVAGTPPTFNDRVKNYAASLSPANAVATGEKTFISNANDSALTNAAEASKLYIGENANIGMTNEVDNSYVALTTKLTVNAEAEWNVSAKAIQWKEVALWGSNANDNSAQDIYVLNLNGKSYFTSSQAKADALANAWVFREAEKVNVHIVGAYKTDPSNTGGADWTTTTPPPTDDPLYTGEEQWQEKFLNDNPSLKPVLYIYYKGYVHFISYINYNNPNADVLRNQLAHIQVTGWSGSKFGSWMFPGWPGQAPTKSTYPNGTGAPRVIIDLTQDDNNPDKLEPGTPIDPLLTAMTVDMTIRPWTYKENLTVIGDK